MRIRLSTLLIVCGLGLAASPLRAQWDSLSMAGMKARSIGPAGMSGRIGAIDAVVNNPNIMFVGAATGGVWRSSNGGVSWKPVFDQQAVSSIGAIAIDQSNPSVVWVGTGEGHTRNTSGVGNGLYKSLDGGDTWRYLGLDKTEKIHNIIVHPSNPDIVYAAALGTTWGENPERGVYKTMDGGKTWKRILFVDARTGCGDLVMDPQNPNKLFAGMWEHRRWPWFFKSGGGGSGLYVTYDGGDTWKRATEKDGMPAGDLGRIGVAIAQTNPNIVYAMVEAQLSVLLRSENGGKTWKKVNDAVNVSNRPFYFSDIYVDPQNEDRVYRLHYVAEVSIDQGRNFETLIPGDKIHGDHHVLWIHPRHGELMIDGNDGGVAITHDRGATWRFVENLPLAQFYHVDVDNATPYHVYGGLQDNGSWRGPSSVWEWGGIRNYHWENVGFGDGFGTMTDRSDSNSGYSMSQAGYLYRFNLGTSEVKVIRPPEPDGVRLRFNWDAAIALDPFNPATVYYGSQFVHQSADRGENWTIISPDLTTNDLTRQKQDSSGGLTLDATGAENFCSIVTIAPSPVKKGVIWVGTDDGQVQVTRDGGQTWDNTTARIPKLPKTTWCPHVEASHFDEGSAFAVFDDHRRNNWATYVYKTVDFGKTWTSLSDNPPKGDSLIWGFAHVITQDPVDANLLFLGTEFGLFVSSDAGKNWNKWTSGFPTVPVTGMIIHPREQDLVVGTHGRGIFILDDISPLRQLSKEIADKALHMFEIPAAIQYQGKAPNGYYGGGDGAFSGENKPYGALITYCVNAKKLDAMIKEEAKKDSTVGGKKSLPIEILDTSGKVIRKMEGPRENGINRVAWNLLQDAFKLPKLGAGPDGAPGNGPEVLPGIYTVRIKLGTQEITGTVTVQQDPRYGYTMKDRRAKYDAIMHVGQRIEVVTEAVGRIQAMQKVLGTIAEQLKDKKDSVATGLKRSDSGLQDSLSQLMARFVDSPDRQGINDASDVALPRLQNVLWFLGSSWDAPSSANLTYQRQAEEKLQGVLGDYNRVFLGPVALFESKLREAHFDFFPDPGSLDMDWTKPKEE